MEGSENVTEQEYIKHAWSLYYKGVDASGSQREYYLQQAKQVLENVSSSSSEKITLLSRINAML